MGLPSVAARGDSFESRNGSEATGSPLAALSNGAGEGGVGEDCLSGEHPTQVTVMINPRAASSAAAFARE